MTATLSPHSTPPVARPPTGPLSPLATSAILVVDDQAIGREALEELLYSPDYKLSFASDGPSALRQATQLTPDLILLDVMMPGMDGFEVCRQLRADPLLAEVPVVMVTALDDQAARLRGLEAGADDFISKPFNRAELRARVKTITRLNRYRRLLSERQRFAWVVEQADDGYLLLDRADQVLYANPRARQFFGLTLDSLEPVTMPFLTLARQQYQLEPETIWAGWPQVSLEGLFRPRYLVRPDTVNAPAFWLQTQLMELEDGTEAIRLLRLRDVTAQVNTKRDVWRFQHAVSHKLRTPLIGVIGGLELLVEHAPQLSAAEVTHWAREALQGARRLHDVIEGVLRYLDLPQATGITANGFPLRELPPLIDTLCAQLGLALPESKGGVAEPAMCLMLTTEAFTLILHELLENAKKFHPRHAPQLEVYWQVVEEKAVTLTVGDDGVNLSPEQLEQVWELYYQGEKFFTGQVPGVGLGLPMVATLVWGVGGQCQLANQPQGPGVRVTLTVPLHSE